MKLKYFLVLMCVAVVGPHFSLVNIIQFISFVVCYSRIFLQAATQNDTNIDVADPLDEIIGEISKMQGNDLSVANGTGSGGQRTVISDIEKLKKIAQILETVGQAVLPAVVDGPLSEANSIKSNVQSEPAKILPKILQHHSLVSNLNEATQVQPQPVAPADAQNKWIPQMFKHL